MQSATSPRQQNPLERAADRVPLRVATFTRLGATVVGAAMAVFVAGAESYNETQVFAVAIAVTALSGLAPARPRIAAPLGVFTAAMLLYAGALLFNVSIGPAILVVGGIATVAALVISHQKRISPVIPVLALFAAMGAVTGLVLVIVFAIGG